MLFIWNVKILTFQSFQDQMLHKCCIKKIHVAHQKTLYATWISRFRESFSPIL